MLIKKYKIPSRSNPGSFHWVELYANGRLVCDCSAGLMNKNCWHKRAVKWWRKEVVGNPMKCFYCGDTRTLQSHHLWPGYADRPYSLTVWLCQKCHHRAHSNSEFIKHLQDLFIKKYGDKFESENKRDLN